MVKYYKVKVDTFLWREGAVLSYDEDEDDGYMPIEDLWNTTDKSEYISAPIIENPLNEIYFERVYMTGGVLRNKLETTDYYKTIFNKKI